MQRLVLYNSARPDELDASTFGLLSGLTAPDDAVGENGDFYFRYSNSTESVYKKSSGTWILVALPVASTVTYDDELIGHELGAAQVQSAIDKLKLRVASTGSTDLSWGRNSTIYQGTYLLNDEIPSNKAGRMIKYDAAIIKSVAFSCDSVDSFTFKVQQHDRSSYEDLVTVPVVSARSGSVDMNVTGLTKGKELAVVVTSGSARNLIVSLSMQGSSL